MESPLAASAYAAIVSVLWIGMNLLAISRDVRACPYSERGVTSIFKFVGLQVRKRVYRAQIGEVLSY